jgi:hypothetical protein
MHWSPPQEFPQDPQLDPELERLAQVPLHPTSPLPQHVPFVQFPFAHWILPLGHDPPFATLFAQVPPLQYLPIVSQLVACAEVQAPAPLQAVADVAVLRSAEQLALLQLVPDPGYAHCVSDDPSQRPPQFALVLVHAV